MAKQNLIAILVSISLLACRSGKQDSASSQGELGLAESVRSRLASLDAKISFYAKHLPSGREIGVEPDTPMNTLSVIKIPIMVLAYKDVEEGRLDLQERYAIQPQDLRSGSGLLKTFDPGLAVSFRDLITQMIITSDNTATDIMIGKLGLDRVNAMLAEQGYEQTRLLATTGKLFHRIWELVDPAAASLSDVEVFERGFPTHVRVSPESFAFEGNPDEWLGRSTAREISRLLEQIHQGKLVSTKHSEEIVEILKKQFYTSRLPRRIRYKAAVAHKTGDWPPYAGNDVGILYYEGGPTIVSVFVNQNRGDFMEVEETIGKIVEDLITVWGSHFGSQQ